MKVKNVYSLIFLLFFSLFSCAQNNLKVDAIFSDNMIFQRNHKIPVWGTAKPNTKIKGVFKEKTVSTIADEKGNWELYFKKQKAGGPFQLTVSSENKTIEFNDILIGEVWLASGQSNMDWKVNQSKHAKTVLKDSLNDQIFLFSMDPMVLKAGKFTNEELSLINANDYYKSIGWSNINTEIIENFSAVSLSTKLIFYRTMVHSIRWRLEVHRMSNADSMLASELRRVPTFSGTDPSSAPHSAPKGPGDSCGSPPGSTGFAGGLASESLPTSPLFTGSTPRGTVLPPVGSGFGSAFNSPIRVSIAVICSLSWVRRRSTACGSRISISKISGSESPSGNSPVTSFSIPRVNSSRRAKRSATACGSTRSGSSGRFTTRGTSGVASSGFFSATGAFGGSTTTGAASGTTSGASDAGSPVWCASLPTPSPPVPVVVASVPVSTEEVVA